LGYIAQEVEADCKVRCGRLKQTKREYIDNIATAYARNMASGFSEKTPPAFDRKNDDYRKWKNKFNLWKEVTDVEGTKQGPLLVLRLDDETQEAVQDLMTVTELKAD
jgi:hypothetical protein